MLGVFQYKFGYNKAILIILVTRQLCGSKYALKTGQRYHKKALFRSTQQKYDIAL